MQYNTFSGAWVKREPGSFLSRRRPPAVICALEVKAIIVNHLLENDWDLTPKTMGTSNADMQYNAEHKGSSFAETETAFTC